MNTWSKSDQFGPLNSLIAVMNFKVSRPFHFPPSVEDIKKRWQHTSNEAIFMPESGKVKPDSSVAIIIPFRNQVELLRYFMAYNVQILRRQNIRFKIYRGLAMKNEDFFGFFVPFQHFPHRDERWGLGSFKIQRYTGIPPLMFLTRPKTYEKLVRTRKKLFFGVLIPAPAKILYLSPRA